MLKDQQTQNKNPKNRQKRKCQENKDKRVWLVCEEKYFISKIYKKFKELLKFLISI